MWEYNYINLEPIERFPISGATSYGQLLQYILSYFQIFQLSDDTIFVLNQQCNEDTQHEVFSGCCLALIRKKAEAAFYSGEKEYKHNLNPKTGECKEFNRFFGHYILEELISAYHNPVALSDIQNRDITLIYSAWKEYIQNLKSLENLRNLQNMENQDCASDERFYSIVLSFFPVCDSAYSLGLFYEAPLLGSEVFESSVRDLKLSKLWYKHAADENDGKAMWKLAQYFSGKYGHPINPVNFFNWCKKAADCGIIDAMEYLALCYVFGIGCKKDIQSAVNYWIKADGVDIAGWKCYVLGKKYSEIPEESYKTFTCDSLIWKSFPYLKGEREKFNSKRWEYDYIEKFLQQYHAAYNKDCAYQLFKKAEELGVELWDL